MIISGKEISTKIKDQLKEEVEQMKNKYDRLPKLAVILVGENQASQVYVRNKERGCSYVGMDSLKITHDATFSEEELLNEIKQLNEDDTVDGILVQLPLPDHINEDKVLEAIDPSKDVDGFHPENVAKLFLGQKSLVPCTPKGMMVLLDEINYDLTGKEVVVVGYSTQQRKDVTGAISSLKIKDDLSVSYATFDQLLQGKLSGVQVQSVSGNPGTAGTIRIRGVGSINGGNDPLYVTYGY